MCVTLTLRYCYTGQPEELAEGESGIAEEVVDAEQFWKGTGFGVFSLGFEDRIAEPGMATAYKLFQWSWPASFWLLAIPIDHALVSEDVRVLDRRMGPSIGSDHLPIVLDIALPANLDR